MLYSKIKRTAALFRRDENGSAAIETVILIPALFGAWLAMFAIFDTYRHHSMSQKAGYMIGDMISRETNFLDPAYLVGTQKLLQFLTLAKLEDTAIRVSSIKYKDNIYEKHWSKVQGEGPSELSGSEIALLSDRLPVMADGEYIVLVETWVEYDPPFDTGLATHDIENFVFTRPRYAPSVGWND